MTMVQQAPSGGVPRGPGPGAAPGAAPRPVNTQRATRWVWALLGAIVAGAAAAGLARSFVQTTTGLWVDEIAFTGSERGRDQLEPVSHLVLSVVGVPFLVGAMVVAVAVSLLRRQWGDAARAVLIVVGANLTTQVLKELIDRPDVDGMASLANSLPSGHTTVAASVAAVALLVAPRPARPLVAILGATYTAATAVATMSLGWHRPSDVIAAIAVVTAWTLLLMVPGSGRAADGFPGTSGRVVASLLLGLVAVVGIGVGVVALVATLGSAGLAADAASVVDGVPGSALTFAYVGSAVAVVGCAAASSWAQLLARR
ncbi:phosphoesterase PA-phosphatase [Serinibacter arcticus]|uniref:Phosphoesterase PA-phosphatase n=1 Tax=Serinibacter arcticus TaxID=1655435 RepID=A0A2U1ZUR5_9MICO|nr:phosphatase PAP2 family protein [Serinibacter arcticus]PWD50662.1 phosphoesterase PA-phosphatase [Serinibacter arcticus]